MSDKLKVEVVRSILAITIAFILLTILVYFVSDAPFDALKQLFIGPISSRRGIGNIFEEWIPLVFTGLCFALVFSSNNFNLAGEGAFYVGSLLAMILALTLNVHPIVFWLMLFVVAGLAGTLVVGTPGFLKNKTGASEIVSSIMIINILFYLGTYILIYYFKDPTARAVASLPFDEKYKLPVIISRTNIHIGIIFAIIATIIIHLLYSHTRLGYKMRITGGNHNFAKVLGINVPFTSLSTQLIGGALAGIGGAVHTLGMYTYFESKLYGYGWDGVIVATLARNNPKYVPYAAMFLAYLRAGSKIMARRTDVPSEVIYIVQGVIILLIVAKSLLAKYEYKLLLKRIDDKKEVSA